jgi:alpha-L-fucosidase
MDRRAFLLSGAFAAGAARLPIRFGPPRARPSAAQLAWHRNELSLFLHFGINTFTDREWGDGSEDPASFNPTRLDARQWVRSAKAGGFRTVILTAKHHDGFCLWPSRVTDHSVKSSPWRSGAGDVVRELANACHTEQIGLGLYLSPWDRNAPVYGDADRYNEFYVDQLTELLTGYGPITEVWFDGANGEGTNGRRQVYDWPRFHATVRRLQPKAVIFSDAGPDIRWIGNERGTAGDPNWCAVDPAVVPYPGADGPEVIDMLQHGDPDGAVWRPGEADVSIRPGWFWHAAENDQVKSGADLLDLYFSSVGRNAGLLLNVPPTREGLLHENDVRSLAEFAERRTRLFTRDLAAGSVRMESDGGHSVRLALPRAVQFDVVSLSEDIGRGQVVSAHHLEVRWQGEWRTVLEGSTIGARRLHRIPPANANEVRLVIEPALGQPHITHLTLHSSDL